MKKDLAEIRLDLTEIRSCIVILKKAVDNENEELINSDISNYLEVTINKMNRIIEDFDN